MIRVDKNIPLPHRYPFAEMDVGDSFEVPAHVKRTAVNVSAKRYGQARGMKFTVRLTPDRKLRCWRVA